MIAKVVALMCLVAASAHAAPRHLNINASPSQLVPQSVAAPNSASEAAKQQAQQAKLHYVEIGPSLKGDYKFGYDTGSGPSGQSFREETRLDDGTVKGAYGYIDANGKQRIVKYTAGKGGFVVDGDQEAPNQGSSSAPASPAPQRQAPEPAPRPQPAALPVQRTSFEQPEPVAQISRVPQQPTQPQLTRAEAEQLHAQQLRQHQLAQQQQLQQQQLLQQQQAAAAQRAQHQQQFSAPVGGSFQQPATHQQAQSGHFFASSNDANLGQLLQNQMRQLQQQQAFAPAANAPQQAPQFSAPQFAAPAAQPANQPIDFNHQQPLRRAPEPVSFQQPQQPQPQAASPQSALLALHQQQQHDAQMLANLRAQQLAQLQQQQPPRQPQVSSLPAPSAPVAQHQRAQFFPAPAAAHAHAHAQPAQQAVVQPAAPQPETFGPPVIDIRTLNYSIGQQTGAN